MVQKQRKNEITASLKECVIKIAVLMVTLIIGLACGIKDSFGAFYIAVLVQAINNIYEACNFLSGYNKVITICQVISFLGASMSAICSGLYFAGYECLGERWIIWGIAGCLSIPIVYLFAEAYMMIKDGRY